MIKEGEMVGYVKCLVCVLSAFFALVVNVNAAELLTQQDVAKVLTQHARENRFPTQMEFQSSADQQAVTGDVIYTFDPYIHGVMKDVYLKYQPDFACFVAIDPETGAILNLSSFIKGAEQLDNLVMRSEYPAASVFKMITAAAGLDLGKVSPSTVIPYNGKSTSLFKKQVLNHQNNKWTRTPTLRESFAKSVNPVFGQLGVFHLGAQNLLDYATRFGFQQQLTTDFELPPSRIDLAFDSQWPIAEAASGYTRDITLSPIHAAQIAAIVANEGKMVTPYMVEGVYDVEGRLLYKSQPSMSSQQVISSQTAQDLRKLMQATTKIGSARKSFSGLHKYKIYRDMKIGGKTGSLTGLSPKGRHDWFVGYAEKDGKRVAYASLVINKEKWYVRSAYVARQFIYEYFTEQQARAKSAEQPELAVSDASQ